MLEKPVDPWSKTVLIIAAGASSFHEADPQQDRLAKAGLMEVV